MEKQTALMQLISELEEIKKTKCNTVMEMLFFDGVLAIIEGKYLPIEKQQIVEAVDDWVVNGNKTGEQYFESTFKTKEG